MNKALNFSNQIQPINWAKKNLFNSLSNSILTVLSVTLIAWIAFGVVNWALTTADWQVITANFPLFFVGRYPDELRWRLWIILGIFLTLGSFQWTIITPKSPLFTKLGLIFFVLLAAVFIIIAWLINVQASLEILLMLALVVTGIFLGKKSGKHIPKVRFWLGGGWLCSFFVVLWLLQGGIFLEEVKLDNLSGLVLTIFTAIISIFLSFPLGVLLALGRQSNLPVIRWLSIAYIEIIRGLPLIGILFMSQIMLGFVLPDDLLLERVVRAIAGFTFFSAAYLAENVRGGLQSIPSGQTEAAKALGLNTPSTIILIILPQALKAVIPSIVGQFISLFKDTSLLAIVGLVDLLGISKSILSNTKYQGDYAEVYLFIALIYWICCYCMFLVSKKIEE